MNEDTAAATSQKRNLKRSFSMSFKKEAITFAETTNNHDAARKFNVDVKRIREWRQKKAEIVDTCAKAKGQGKRRLEGGGRKITDEGLEEQLLEWIHGRRSSGLRVSRKLIMMKAKFLYDETCDESEKDLFLASNGWLQKFMRRNGLSLRRKTTTAQKDPAKLIDKLISYVLHVRRLSKAYNYQPSCIIAMDETSVWDDMVSNTTVDDVGAKSISLKTTGHEKVMVSVCLAAKADGTKLKPMIVFRGAKRETKALAEEFKNRCVVASSKNAWMNEELTLLWVQRVIGAFSFNRRLLAWDSFECHIMDTVKEALKRMNVDQAVIPGGCTKYIQAPDVCWNKPFKTKVTEMYDEWMSNGIHQFTSGGNMKPPTRRTIVQWVLEAWSLLSTEIIKKSFKTCALNLPVDGSQDSDIHCFKEGQLCAAGLTSLQSQLSLLDKSEHPDPFKTSPIRTLKML